MGEQAPERLIRGGDWADGVWSGRFSTEPGHDNRPASYQIPDGPGMAVAAKELAKMLIREQPFF